MTGIFCLPREVLNMVFFYLKPADLFSTRAVCRLFYTLSTQAQHWRGFLSDQCPSLAFDIEQTLTHRSWQWLLGQNEYLARTGFLADRRVSLLSGARNDAANLSDYEKSVLCCDLYVACFLNAISNRNIKGAKNHAVWNELVSRVGGESVNVFNLKEDIDAFIQNRLKGTPWLDKELNRTIRKCLSTITGIQRSGKTEEQTKFELDYAHWKRICHTVVLRDAGAKVERGVFARAISQPREHPTLPWMIEAGREPTEAFLESALQHRCPYEVVEVFLRHVSPSAEMIAQAQDPNFYCPRVSFLLRGVRVIETELDEQIRRKAKPVKIREMCEAGHRPDHYTLFLAIHCQRSYKVVSVLLQHGAEPSRSLVEKVVREGFYSPPVAEALQKAVLQKI